MIPGLALKISAGLLLITTIYGSGFLILKGNNPKNLGEKLSNEGIIVLNTDPDSHIHKEEWEKIVQKYEGNENNENKIESLVLSAPSENDHNRTKNIKNLKEKCKNLISTPLKNDNDLLRLEKLTINWCIKDAKGLKTVLK